MAPPRRCIAPSAHGNIDVQTKAYDARHRRWCRSFILPYAAPLSLFTTIRDHLRSHRLVARKPDGGEAAPPGEGRSEERMGKRTLALYFSPHFSSDFRVESGTKSSPFGTEFSSFAASFFVGESEKKSR